MQRTTSQKKKRITPDSKERIAVSSAKDKGRRLQYQICAKISELLNIPWEQDNDNSLIKSRSMGQKGVDIILTGKAKELFLFSVECKWQETWSVPAWIEHAKSNQIEGTDWLLVCKRSRQKPIVVMDADVFFTILGEKK